MKKALLFGVFILSLALNAQNETNKERAFNLGMEAVKAMDNEGNYEKAITLLQEAQSLDKQNINYPYEISYSYYLLKNYSKTIEILEKIKNHKNVNDRIYQLLGNSYDYTGNPEKALSIYRKGLKKFPNSGKLYLEQGILENSRENYNKAIAYWEKGIEVEPTFSSNYYWLGKTFSYSDEKIWSILYGEIFINLERNSNRTAEISELLYKTYKESIHITSDSTGGVSFSKVNIIGFKKNKIQIPFPIVFGLTMTASLRVEILNKETQISISSINKIRQSFIFNWYSQKRNKKYPNIIFDFQKQLKDEGNFESYNYWLFMKGNEIEFNKWLLSNQPKFDKFIEWFLDNPMDLNEKNYFSRIIY
jgi:tetratricopeptide (TPR) repeat protein